MPNKGFKHSEHTKRLISLHSASKRKEIREKISKALKGRVSTYKGKKDTPEIRIKKRIAHLGIPRTLKTRLAIARANKGDKSHFWKGGINKINNTVRGSIKYKLWREKIFKRDNWTCVFCKKRGCKLEADHIKPFAYYPKLRFLMSNGRTLCKECHKLTDTYAKNKTKN